MTTPRKPTRAAAMRKAFERQFGAMTAHTGYGYDIAQYNDEQRRAWHAFRAGAAWQRRQRRAK
jgi:N-acetyl-anhydromuramyl-L-alanine amidase AmpD